MTRSFYIFIVISTLVAGSVRAELIDDMESYPLGNVRDTAASAVWNSNSSSFADIESASGNQFFSFGWDDAGYRGAHRSLGTTIGVSATSTLFFKVRAEDDRINHAIGLTEVAVPSTQDGGLFADFRSQIALTADGTASDGNFDLVSGATTLTTGLTTNTWYNVWMVIDNANDTIDVYLNTGSSDATAGDKLNGTPVAFLNTTAAALDRFVTSGSGAVGGVEHSVHVDDINLAPGVQLGNPPIPEPATLILAAAGLSGLFGFKRRRKAKNLVTPQER